MQLYAVFATFLSASLKKMSLFFPSFVALVIFKLESAIE